MLIPQARDGEEAIRRGLAFLEKNQGGTGFFSRNYPVATTALAGIAFLGSGADYDRGPYGDVLLRAVEYLENHSTDNGYIEADGNSRMHGHGYAVLFLSQVLGGVPRKEHDKRLREVVEKGVQLILESQTVRGGWGYKPDSLDDEASITVCCLQALRAARNAGILVPKHNIDAAVDYLRQCCKEDGSFRYSLARGVNRSSYELTAAAVSTLDAAGEYASKEHRKGVDFLRKKLSEFAENPLDASQNYPFYGNLYAAQVYFQVGGELWETWAPAAYRQLLAKQREDGSWESGKGAEYATAMALLILEIPRGYLPIFER